MSGARIEPGTFVLANPDFTPRRPISRQVRRRLDRAFRKDSAPGEESPDWESLIDLAEKLEGGEL